MAKKTKKKPVKKAAPKKAKKVAPKKKTAAKKKATPKKKAAVKKAKPVAKKKAAPKAKVAPKKKAAKKSPAKKATAPKPVRTLTAYAYVNYHGNCEEAFNFYKSVFGGEFTSLARFNEMPPMEGQPPLSEEDKNKIMHVSLNVGSCIIMGSDALDNNPMHTFKAGNNFSVMLNPTSKAEADKLFTALSNGGFAPMPMMDTFWGAYFGFLTDKFGLNWMINYAENPM